jgi:hypothetical protein
MNRKKEVRKPAAPKAANERLRKIEGDARASSSGSATQRQS